MVVDLRFGEGEGLGGLGILHLSNQEFRGRSLQISWGLQLVA